MTHDASLCFGGWYLINTSVNIKSLHPWLPKLRPSKFSPYFPFFYLLETQPSSTTPPLSTSAIQTPTQACLLPADFQLPPPYGQSFFKTPSGRFHDARLLIDFFCKFLTMHFCNVFTLPHNFTVYTTFTFVCITHVNVYGYCSKHELRQLVKAVTHPLHVNLNPHSHKFNITFVLAPWLSTCESRPPTYT